MSLISTEILQKKKVMISKLPNLCSSNDLFSKLFGQFNENEYTSNITYVIEDLTRQVLANQTGQSLKLQPPTRFH